MADKPPNTQPSQSKDATSTETNGQIKKPSTPGTKPETESKGLSNAEKKKLAKAEKQARRAQEKTGTQSNNTPPAHDASQNPPAGAQPAGKGKEESSKQSSKSSSQPKPDTTKQAQKQPSQNATQDIPHRPRRRSSASNIAQATKTSSTGSKQIPFLAHLYPVPPSHPAPIAHPCIQTLTQLQSTYTICGSHARTLALLQCLKTLVRAYTTPPSTSLPRHLPTTYLSPHLSYLKSYSRPFCPAQAASIRWFKRVCSKLDPSALEEDSKRRLVLDIDTFINERLTIADQIIASTTVTDYIVPGSNILVYANSAIVRSTLAHAIKSSILPLKITIIDARPLHEGAALAETVTRSVHAAGIPRDAIELELAPITALDHAVRDASLCILGASAVHPNGTVSARSGTALVAMAARLTAAIPVVVLAEGLKFVERAAVDSLGSNELAPEEALLDDAAELEAWRRGEGVALVSLLYDTVPKEWVSAIVTEYGRVEPGSAGLVQRLAGLGLGDDGGGGGVV